MSAAAPRTSLAGEAYVVVRARILRGELRFGEAISRRKLASELGMSFLPVSEAMLRLEMEGLVESRPRAGTRVCLPSADHVAGQHVVRAALEAQAARLFCQVASAPQRAALRELGEQLDALCGKSDVASYLSLHQALHAAIARGAACASLAAAIDRANALTLACASTVSDASARWWRVEHAALAEI